MTMRLAVVTLFVNDQDEALGFYVDRVGFEVAEDNRMGEFRWLLVSAPGTPDVGINLKLAENPEQRNLVGKQGGGAPVFALATSDCRRDYERMKARDVALDGEPQTMPLALESKFARRMDAHEWNRMRRPTTSSR